MNSKEKFAFVTAYCQGLIDSNRIEDKDLAKQFASLLRNYQEMLHTDDHLKRDHHLTQEKVDEIYDAFTEVLQTSLHVLGFETKFIGDSWKNTKTK